MFDVRLYLAEIENSNKAEATKVAQQAAQRLQSKDLKLVELIESCGEYLNNDSAVTRERTMSFLAEVLTETPYGVLPAQHRALLLEFVISRIEDREVGIGSGAKALIALEERGKWTQDVASRVLTSYASPRRTCSTTDWYRLLQNTHPLIQSGSQAQRYPVLLLIDVLMAKYRDAISQLNASDTTFLSRFVSYFDGEKDPRNLMVVFSILAVVTTEWDISSSVQEVFDASFNYFPITFRPPPDDVYKITAQDLKDRLRKCISANSALAPYAYPALLDKLDSTSPNTKRDVLTTILETTVNYGPRTIALYSITLWDALKYEVLQIQDEDLARQSLDVLAGIATSLSQGSKEGLHQYLKPVVKECNEHLEDALTKQSDAALRILTSIAPTSPEALNFIISGVLPQVLRLYKSSKDVAKKRSLVEVLDKLITSSITIYGDWLHVPATSQDARASPNALKNSSGDAFELLYSALSGTPAKSVSFRLALIEAALDLSKAREILKDQEISKIIKVYNDIILVEEFVGKDEVKDAATKALAVIAQQKPQLVIDHSFPAFLSRIPDTDADSTKQPLSVLEAFAKLGAEDKIFDIVLVRLRSKVNAALHQKASNAYVQSLLSAMLYIFGHVSKPLPGTDEHCQCYSEYVEPLLTTTLASLHAGQREDATVAIIGRIANEVVRDQPAAFQSARVAASIYPAPVVRNGESFYEFEQRQDLILSVHLLAALRRDTSVQFDDASLVASILNISARSELSGDIKAAALQNISLLVNKFLSKPTISTKLQPLVAQLLDKPTEPHAVQAIFCILKALLLRNIPTVSSMFPPLIGLLKDADIGLAVAYGFSSLLQPDPILTKENHCIISPLYKHKTFAIVVPDLATGFRNADATIKKHYLIALAGILRWLPYAVLEPELETLTPLLLQTLDIDGEYEIKAGTINEITIILSQNSGALEEHASSLITRLLNIASAGNLADLRSKALQCLTVVASQLRTEIVVPFRKSVVQRLAAALDDRKRAVRAEAVRCRRRWIELDTAAGDDDDEE